jgi:phospholipid/cholesterol/gamma-HCH transport system substrate-binding protein
MAAPNNHWKLGLFMVTGFALALGTVGVLGARSMRKDVGLYVSFFDESVQGLEVGSPIKFRGVTVGTVGRIRVASDHRHVEIESELLVEELARLGLDVAATPGLLGAIPKLEMAADLRLQLASSGLTGVKFLQLDFFDVVAYPPPVLPFKVPSNTIPTAASTMKNLEDSLTRMMNSLPELTDRTASILQEVDAIVTEVNEQRFPSRLSATLKLVEDLVKTAEEKLAPVDVHAISLDAHGLIQDVRISVSHVNGVLERVNSKDGLLTSVSGATRHLDGILERLDRDNGLLSIIGQAGTAISQTMNDASSLGVQLLGTLSSVQEASRSIRKLTEALELDPDMLLKGRSPPRSGR